MEGLKGIYEVVLPKVADGASHVYHLFTIRTPRRDALQQYLADKGIETMIHYLIPPHLQKAFQHLGYQKGDFPVAEEIANTTLSLPVFIGLQKNDVNKVCDAVNSFFQGNRSHDFASLL